MYERKSIRYGKVIKIIHPGEFYVSSTDEIIATLLGSCVSVCLYDPERLIAGMNHFMLPGRIASTDIFDDRSARYGITAINELLIHMEEAGSSRSKIIAKIFGGGHVLDGVTDIATIPLDNIRLAKIMIEIEDIPISQIEVGGVYTRKILMDVVTGKVYLRKTTKKQVYSKIDDREKDYGKREFGASWKR